MRIRVKTSEFKRCVKLLARRRWDLTPLVKTMDMLAADVPSSELYKDHPLSGRFAGKRECHVTNITDNWVLVYHKTDDNRLYLHGTGTHADVFG